MKIEMGESLMYSWLRHVKECKIVQTNWKTSPQWEMFHKDELEHLMAQYDRHFSDKHNLSMFKKNSLKQLIGQAEADVIGMAFSEGRQCIYAIDVAYHESGLNYGSKDETITRVIKKCIRTVLCLYGYFDIKEGEVIFASPKINPVIMNTLVPLIGELDALTKELGLGFKMRLLANDDFNTAVLQPILLVSSDGVSDTSELFLRSVQMYRMFSGKPKQKTLSEETVSEANGAYSEMKIGKIVNTIFRSLLASGQIDDDIIKSLQTPEYSRNVLHLQYPALVSGKMEFDRLRYYSAPVLINGQEYFICSQWFESDNNNDRPYLLAWLSDYER